MNIRTERLTYTGSVMPLLGAATMKTNLCALREMGTFHLLRQNCIV